MTMLRVRRPLHGLGFSLPDHIAGTLQPVNPRVVEALTRESAGLPGSTMQAIESASVVAAADGGIPQSTDSDRCGCLVQAADDYAAQIGQMLDPAAKAEAAAQCTVDAVAFEGFLNQLGIDTKSCTAWYKQPRNLAIGGAVLLAGGLLLWSRR
jgi:hypothetical protein